MLMGQALVRWRIGVAGVLAALVVAVGGCAALESLFSPPPPPPVRKEPAPPPVKKEPEPAPPKKEPEAPPPPKKEPEPAPPKKEPPAPPVKKEPVVPPPPVRKEPAPPPVKKEPDAPSAKQEPDAAPPVLAPQVGKQDEEQLRRETSTRIQRAELLIGRIDDKKLSKEQQEQFLTIQSLLRSAKEAVETKDLTRASNLAEKARILAEELAQATR
jgi:outer membrane biosynthesis protein TonB